MPKTKQMQNPLMRVDQLKVDISLICVDNWVVKIIIS